MPGQSYTQTETFILPRGIGGTEADPQTFYVYVIADPQRRPPSRATTQSMMAPSRGFFGGNAYENPTNNQGGGAIPVIYREPSLVVSKLIVPSTPPNSGTTIPVTWTVTNTGNRDTHESYWIDNIYLSSRRRWKTHRAVSSILLGQSPHYGILQTGASYTVTLNVHLPDGVEGNYYIVVYTGRGAALPGPNRPVSGPNDLEYLYVTAGMNMVPQFAGEGYNTTAALLPVILSNPPDLQVASVDRPGPQPQPARPRLLRSVFHRDLHRHQYRRRRHPRQPVELGRTTSISRPTRSRRTLNTISPP